ncbi:hypothetical protein Plhal304r1_c005g0022191 [Plasmopara halstedii]
MTISSEISKLKLLLLSDTGGKMQRVNEMCEKLVSSEDCDVSAVLVSGGLVANRWPQDYERLEAVAAAEGDMMALISRLEMIICRVIYITDDVSYCPFRRIKRGAYWQRNGYIICQNDPPTTHSKTASVPSLTQYSSNINYRDETIVDGVTVMGEARYFKLINDGKDPMQDRDMVLVLRDSTAKTQLPAAESSFFAGLLPMLHSNKFKEPCAIEIIGGSTPHPHVQLPVIYSGSLQLGQYTILQLEKDSPNDKWCVAAVTSHELKSEDDEGTHDSVRGKPGDTSNLRELERLRVLVMYEFEPPLSSQELVEALRSHDNHVEHACEYLKLSRRHKRLSGITTSTPLDITNVSMMAPEREKRRLSVSSVDDKSTPSKRHKDCTSSSTDTSEEEEEHESDEEKLTQQDCVLISAPNCSRAQQLLIQTIEDRVASEQPLRNPEWLHQVWTSLRIPAILEIGMQLNLTVDASVTWVKGVDPKFSSEIQPRAAALIVEVLANLPTCTIDTASNEVGYLLKDDVLSMKVNDVESFVQAESEAAEGCAYARANAAKLAIESLSSACNAYMDRLIWFKEEDDKNTKESTEVREIMEVLSQKLAVLVDDSNRDVEVASCVLCEAKQKKEVRSMQIVEVVHKRREELLSKGETEACATLDSVVGVWKKDDSEVQALWTSRSECERQVNESERTLKVTKHASAFYKNLQILFQKVRERREKALISSLSGLKKAREGSDAQATAALKKFVPMLARALGQFYEFHSIQQLKAKEELREQETALAAHNEYFGDSAPIKKGDLERRIQEFIGVTERSMQIIMELADRQQQLWTDKHTVLPESVRSILIDEFKAVWAQLSGPIKDVMKNVVASLEEIAGDAVAVEVLRDKHMMPDSSVSMIVASSTSDEQIIPAFTEPAFLKSHVEAISPYRTAISPVVAQNLTFSLPDEEMPKTWISSLPGNNENETAFPLHHATPAPGEMQYNFEIGSNLYSRITAGESCSQFVRGVVLKRLSNGMYLMQYENGDKFSVDGSYLFTKDMMEQSLKVAGAISSDENVEMESAEQTSSERFCVIM